MQAAIKHSIEQRPGPSSAAFSTLMRQIEQEKQALQRHASRPTEPSWWKTVESTFRSLFEVPWVPALASILIVGQAFLLFSLIGSPEGHRGKGLGSIIERGIPKGTPQVPLLKIRVGFQDGVQEQQIRAILHKIEGRIIDGPSSDGTYTLAVAQQGTMTLDTLLHEIRQQVNLIRLAEPLQP